MTAPVGGDDGGDRGEPGTAARFAEVETLLTHLQRELGQMHSVLLAHTAEIAALNRRADKLEARLDRLGEEPESPDPRAHEPPHY